MKDKANAKAITGIAVAVIILTLVFAAIVTPAAAFVKQTEDDIAIDVFVQLTAQDAVLLEAPANFTIGNKVTICGTITSGVDEVAIFVDNVLQRRVAVEVDGTYEWEWDTSLGLIEGPTYIGRSLKPGALTIKVFELHPADLPPNGIPPVAPQPGDGLDRDCGGDGPLEANLTECRFFDPANTANKRHADASAVMLAVEGELTATMDALRVAKGSDIVVKGSVAGEFYVRLFLIDSDGNVVIDDFESVMEDDTFEISLATLSSWRSSEYKLVIVTDGRDDVTILTGKQLGGIGGAQCAGALLGIGSTNPTTGVCTGRLDAGYATLNGQWVAGMTQHQILEKIRSCVLPEAGAAGSDDKMVILSFKLEDPSIELEQIEPVANFTIGDKVTICGTTTSAVDEVAIFVDNVLQRRVAVEVDGTYEWEWDTSLGLIEGPTYLGRPLKPGALTIKVFELHPADLPQTGIPATVPQPGDGLDRDCGGYGPLFANLLPECSFFDPANTANKRHADTSTTLLAFEGELTATMDALRVAKGRDIVVKGAVAGEFSVRLFLIDSGGDVVIDDFESVMEDDTFEISLLSFSSWRSSEYKLVIVTDGRDDVTELTGNQLGGIGGVQCAGALLGIGSTNPTTGVCTGRLDAGGATLNGQWVAGMTQHQILEKIKSCVLPEAGAAGSDDKMVILSFRLEDPSIKLEAIEPVAVGEPLNIRGTTNREPGTLIAIWSIEEPEELADTNISAAFSTIMPPIVAPTGGHNDLKLTVVEKASTEAVANVGAFADGATAAIAVDADVSVQVVGHDVVITTTAGAEDRVVVQITAGQAYFVPTEGDWRDQSLAGSTDTGIPPAPDGTNRPTFVGTIPADGSLVLVVNSDRTGGNTIRAAIDDLNDVSNGIIDAGETTSTTSTSFIKAVTTVDVSHRKVTIGENITICGTTTAAVDDVAIFIDNVLQRIVIIEADGTYEWEWDTSLGLIEGPTYVGRPLKPGLKTIKVFEIHPYDLPPSGNPPTVPQPGDGLDRCRFFDPENPANTRPADALTYIFTVDAEWTPLLPPAITEVEWPTADTGVFNATIDTTGAIPGIYTIEARDGEGNCDATTVEIFYAQKCE